MNLYLRGASWAKCLAGDSAAGLCWGWVGEALGGAGSCATKSLSSPMPRVCLSRSKYELRNARSKEQCHRYAFYRCRSDSAFYLLILQQKPLQMFTLTLKDLYLLKYLFLFVFQTWAWISL